MDPSIPMYRIFLQGDRIDKNNMYLYLTDTRQTSQKPNAAELVENHAKILANVLFKQRGNDYIDFDCSERLK